MQTQEDVTFVRESFRGGYDSRPINPTRLNLGSEETLRILSGLSEKKVTVSLVIKYPRTFLSPSEAAERIREMYPTHEFGTNVVESPVGSSGMKRVKMFLYSSREDTNRVASIEYFV